MNNIKVCIVTGTRAEYGLLKPVMEAIQKEGHLRLQVVATGAHLFPGSGMTIKEIIKDGFKIDAKVKMTPPEDTVSATAESIGKGIIGISKTFKKIRPDIVVVLGDRVEALAAAIAAVYSKIALAHIHGGDSPKAGFDEYARHAITKLAHIHFPVTQMSAKRIIKMGENPKNIYVVGAPGLDSIFHEKFLGKGKIEKKYNLDLSLPLLLVIHHSVSTEDADALLQVQETLKAVTDLRFQTIIIYPNVDAGGRRIAGTIEKYRRYSFVRIFKNIPRQDYLGLLRVASVLVGNSSSGIIEAPAVHLATVNIGSRQDGRERTCNVIDVPYDRKKIKEAINKAINDKNFRARLAKCKSIYGDGNAGFKIAKILGSIKIEKELFQKKITY